MCRAQIIRINTLTSVGTSGSTQNNEFRQILIQGAKTVMNPRTNTWLRLIKTMPSRMNLILRSMVVISRPHIANETNIINLLCNMRPPVGNTNSIFTVLLISNLHWKDGGVDIAHINIQRRHAAKTLLMQRRFNGIGKRCL